MEEYTKYYLGEYPDRYGIFYDHSNKLKNMIQNNEVNVLEVHQHIPWMDSYLLIHTNLYKIILKDMKNYENDLLIHVIKTFMIEVKELDRLLWNRNITISDETEDNINKILYKFYKRNYIQQYEFANYYKSLGTD